MSMHSKKLAAGAMLVGALIGFGASTSNAAIELKLDMVLGGGGGGGKAATVSPSTTSVPLDLYAYVVDPDQNPDNTGFNVTQGGWQSVGLLMGDLAAQLGTGFAEFGSANPAPSDWDADGDLDVGNKAAATSGLWIAAAGTSGRFDLSIPPEVAMDDGTGTIRLYKKWLIGSGAWTPKPNMVPGTSVALNYVPRTGAGAVNPHKYYKDSGTTLTAIKGSDARLAVGAPVVLTAGTLWNAHLDDRNMPPSEGTVHVVGAFGHFISEVLDTPDNVAKAGVGIYDMHMWTPNDDAYVMLWMQGAQADIDKVLAAVDSQDDAEVVGPGNTVYDALAQAPEYSHPVFNGLIKFPHQAIGPMFFSWDFAGSGVTVDKVAVVPEPASMAVVGLGAACLLMARRRRAA